MSGALHWDHPLADWEWFWYDEDGRDTPSKRAKLLSPTWSPPVLHELGDSLRLVFSRPNVVLQGIDLSVDVTFRPAGSFSVTYGIANQRPESLHMPYVMVGLPGFSNHRWISAVATTLEPRTCLSPFTSFWQEAMAVDRKEYTLLRDDALLVPQEELKGVTAMSTFGTTYLLSARYRLSGVEARAYSAHVNKPGYLTSHLYILLNDMAPYDSVSLPVHYQLSREGEHSAPLW